MAEFQEVLKQWNRMCKAFGEDCDKCPIKYSPCQYISFDILYLSSKEQPIMKWAAENPEPVYPTWLEWLEKMGIMADIHDRLNNYKQVMEVCGKPLYSIPTTKVFCPIPADIAQKLGIEPQEGV